jgi:hypothetical protein
VSGSSPIAQSTTSAQAPRVAARKTHTEGGSLSEGVRRLVKEAVHAREGLFE